jgi:SAM-dependent methyltransferase
MADADAARHFDSVAARYTELRASWLTGFLRRQEQTALHELAVIEPGERVLDAGCGDGATLDWLASRRARAVGYDLVPAMAKLCRRRGHLVCVQDMEHAGFQPLFDWVLCVGSMEFAREPAHAVGGFASCLLPSGRLVLLFPRRGPLGLLYAAYHRSHGVRIRLFSADEIESLLERAGLRPDAWRHGTLSSLCRAQRLAAGAPE